ncbi:alpha/beta hydrolase [Oerskovia sp. M15]
MLVLAAALLGARRRDRGPSPRRPQARRVLRGVAVGIGIALLVVLAAAVVAPALPATAPALAALESDGSVEVRDEAGWIAFVPRDGAATTGLVYSPGARVDVRATAAVLRPLAEAGYLVVALKEPLGIAFTSPNQSASAMAAFDEVDTWAVGGHSLGGVVAASFAAAHDDEVTGLLLHASYPSGDMSTADVEVTSVWGSRDGLTTPDKIEASRADLPATADFVEVPGASTPSSPTTASNRETVSQPPAGPMRRRRSSRRASARSTAWGSGLLRLVSGGIARRSPSRTARPRRPLSLSASSHQQGKGDANRSRSSRQASAQLSRRSRTARLLVASSSQVASQGSTSRMTSCGRMRRTIAGWSVQWSGSFVATRSTRSSGSSPSEVLSSALSSSLKQRPHPRSSGWAVEPENRVEILVTAAATSVSGSMALLHDSSEPGPPKRATLPGFPVPGCSPRHDGRGSCLRVEQRLVRRRLDHAHDGTGQVGVGGHERDAPEPGEGHVLGVVRRGQAQLVRDLPRRAAQHGVPEQPDREAADAIQVLAPDRGREVAAVHGLVQRGQGLRPQEGRANSSCASGTWASSATSRRAVPASTTNLVMLHLAGQGQDVSPPSSRSPVTRAPACVAASGRVAGQRAPRAGTMLGGWRSRPSARCGTGVDPRRSTSCPCPTTRARASARSRRS